MTEQVILAKAIEIILMVMTSILLIQPKVIFRVSKPRPVFTWGGMLLLCITFCWSVVFGAILFMNDLTIKI